MPKVSIVTVVYNGALTIADTLRSVQQQTYADIEHIVIDGASTDETLAVVRQFPHVAHVLSEPDSGIYDAMNKGVSLATGDIVALLNADDQYQHDEVVEQAVNVMRESAVEACYADLVYVKQRDTRQVVRYWRSQTHQPGLCFSGWMPAHPTLFLLRSVYERAGLFDTSMQYQADLEFCARIFEKYKISSIYVPNFWVRMRMGGVTNRSLTTIFRGNWESYQALRKMGLKTACLPYFVKKLAPRIVQYLRRP